MTVSGTVKAIAVLLAVAVGATGIGIGPVAAQTAGDKLDTILEKRAKRKEKWDSSADWRADRRDRREAAAATGLTDDEENPFGDYAGETLYERQMRGLYAPGYDIEGVLQNNYNGNRN